MELGGFKVLINADSGCRTLFSVRFLDMTINVTQQNIHLHQQQMDNIVGLIFLNTV